MDFFEAIQTSLSKYATFEGRAPRAEFWWFFLFNMIVSVIGRFTPPILPAVVSLVLLLPNLAVHVRRLHDVDRSGWYLAIPMPAALITLVFALVAYSSPTPGFTGIVAVLALVTLASYLVLLVWYCQRGTIGPNRFGPDPLAPDPHAAMSPSA